MMVISFQLNSAQVRLFRAIIFLIFSNETLKAEASEKETKSQLQGALSHWSLKLVCDACFLQQN